MLGIRTVRFAIAGVVGMLAIAGCERSPIAGPRPAPAAASTPATPALPFEPAEIVEQVRHAFRSDGSDWEGGSETYASRHDAAGTTVRFVAPGQVAPSGPRIDTHPTETPSASATAAGSQPIQLTVGPTRLGRGGQLRELGGTWERDARGGLLLEAGGVVEHRRNLRVGLSQSWDFAERPVGEGSLVVEVPLTGQAFASTTAGGLHFAARQDAVGFRYGHGTWIDADGRQTRIPSVWTGDRVRLTVPADVLAESRFPAVLDPIISPELSLDVPVPSRSDGAVLSTTASNGRDFLVAWISSSADGSFIRAARVDAEGLVLDPGGVTVTSTSQGSIDHVAVASDGSDYLLGWITEMPPLPGPGYQIRVARMSAEGSVLPVDGRVVAASETAAFSLAIASNGEGFLLTWVDYSFTGLPAVAAMRLGLDAAPLDAAPRLLSAPAAKAYPHVPALCSGAGGYMVAWAVADGPIHGTFITGAGDVVSPGGRPLSPESGTRVPALATNGNGFLLAYSVDRTVIARRLGADGVPLEAPTIRLEPESASTPAMVHAAAHGRGTLVSWSLFSARGTSQTFANLVTESGELASPTGFVLPEARNTSLASNGSRILVSSGGPGVSISSLMLDGTSTGTPVLLSLASEAQRDVTIAHSGNMTLLAWTEERWTAQGPVVRATRLASDGQLLDLEGFELTPAGGTGGFPIAASDGSGFVVAWASIIGHGTLHTAGISPDGQVRTAAPLALDVPPAAEGRPTLASNGQGYLLAWADPRDRQLRAVPLGSEGSPILPSAAVVTPGGVQAAPALAAAGSDYVLAYLRPDADRAPAVAFVRVAPQTGLASSSGPQLLSAPGRTASAPAIATGALGSLVAWTSFNAGGWELEGMLVSGSGVEVPPWGSQIHAGVTFDARPQVASDGNTYLAAWEHRGDIVGKVLDVDGTPPRAEPMAISTAMVDERQPAIAALGRGAFLVGYERFDPSAGAHAVRVTARRIEVPESRPEARSFEIQTAEDFPITFPLRGTSSAPGTIGYRITTPPRRGTLEVVPGGARYVPAPDAFGEDTFWYVADDGVRESVPAEVRIWVMPVDDAPIAHPGEWSTSAGVPIAILLQGTDPEGSPLTYNLVSEPAVGALEGTPPALTYVPPEGFHGVVAFAFTVHDGLRDSQPSTVTITVGNGVAALRLGEIPPTDEGHAVRFTLDLSAPVGAQPALWWDFGDGTGSQEREPRHLYRDDGDYVATVTATSSTGATTRASVAVSVRNVAPRPEPVAPLEVREETLVQQQLRAWDPAGEADPLTWTLLDGPGTLEPSGAWSWRPAAGDVGTHHVRAQVQDDEGATGQLSFAVVVTAPQETTAPEPTGCTAGGGPASLAWFVLLALPLLHRRVRRG